MVARLSVASEHAFSDFKRRYDTTDPAVPFEIAKDICAFANHLGGTIVVGAIEGKGGQRGRIANFAPLVAPSPGDLVNEVDRVVRMLCLPVPIANALEIPLDETQVEAILGRIGPATSIVAINVPAEFNTPVGCLTCATTCKECEVASQRCSCNGKTIPEAYRFPIRVIEGTRNLRPNELARTMNVVERRALLELQAIATEKVVYVWFNSQSGFQRQVSPCEIVSIDPAIMVCVLRLVHVGPPNTAEVPLTFVRATWRTSNGWNVAIEGSAFDGAGDKREGFRPPGNARQIG